MSSFEDRGPHPVLALGLGWLIPGAGHAYVGRWGKAAFFFAAVLSLQLAGMIMGGGTVFLWSLWMAAQLCAGGPALVFWSISQHLAGVGQGVDWADRLHETGTLYTAVAGFLNVLIMMDAYLKADNPHHGSDKEAS
jgi:hypothetical protein